MTVNRGITGVRGNMSLSLNCLTCACSLHVCLRRACCRVSHLDCFLCSHITWEWEMTEVSTCSGAAAFVDSLFPLFTEAAQRNKTVLRLEFRFCCLYPCDIFEVYQGGWSVLSQWQTIALLWPSQTFVCSAKEPASPVCTWPVCLCCIPTQAGEENCSCPLTSAHTWPVLKQHYVGQLWFFLKKPNGTNRSWGGMQVRCNLQRCVTL